MPRTTRSTAAAATPADEIEDPIAALSAILGSSSPSRSTLAKRGSTKSRSAIKSAKKKAAKVKKVPSPAPEPTALDLAAAIPIPTLDLSPYDDLRPVEAQLLAQADVEILLHEAKKVRYTTLLATFNHKENAKSARTAKRIKRKLRSHAEKAVETAQKRRAVLDKARARLASLQSKKGKGKAVPEEDDDVEFDPALFISSDEAEAVPKPKSKKPAFDPSALISDTEGEETSGTDDASLEESDPVPVKVVKRKVVVKKEIVTDEDTSLGSSEEEDEDDE